ncbi:MAG: Fis family transcriptional regulator, partial [Candidatus Sulfotelmatobacter sp.]
MENAGQSPAKVPPRDRPEDDESGLFSVESVLKLEKLVFAGSPLSAVLTQIAQFVEAQARGMFCTIWLPDEEANYLYCAAAPSLPGFGEHVGRTRVCPKGASCVTAVYRREPVY